MTSPSLTSSTAEPKENKLLRKEISDKQFEVKAAQHTFDTARAELRELRREESASRGLEPAFIGTSDLITIIEDLLLTESPISKAFRSHEIRESKCKKWTDRTIRYGVNKKSFSEATDALLNKGNTQIKLMKDYNVLDIKSIVKSDSYSAGLNKLKKQLKVTLMLKDKDDQLAAKDKTISDKDIEIKRLNDELLRNKGEDWKSRAIELMKSGTKKSDIAKLVGKGRTTVSTYLNQPEVKCLTE